MIEIRGTKKKKRPVCKCGAPMRRWYKLKDNVVYRCLACNYRVAISDADGTVVSEGYGVRMYRRTRLSMHVEGVCNVCVHLDECRKLVNTDELLKCEQMVFSEEEGLWI